MGDIRVLLLFLAFIQGNCLAENFEWGAYYQNDYDVNMERAQITWYNHSYLRNLEFKVDFYNRTVKALNGSIVLLVDINRDVQIDVQFYKFMSNEYRFFPITLAIHGCEDYAHNSFNMQKWLNKSSNIKGCPMKKGNYYIRKMVPDFSALPPYIPHGAYKADFKVRVGTNAAANGEGYASVVDKPIKWD